ncbi:MAG: hypothetical protein H6812_00235 [Phycisphaeraceae bacterium]|nr:hypothetical protein [Phycisphaeraceae bacterium]
MHQQLGTKKNSDIVHEVRIGTVRVTVHATREPDGRPNHGVEVRRLLESDTGELSETTTLSRDDLLLVARALDQAHAFICRSQRE